MTTASRTQSWQFDPLGNWSTLTTDGNAQTRTHNKQNQITSISGLTTPTYDANGNTIGDENGKTLVYDAWNRLVAYKNGSTVLASYSHDALRRRITEGSSRVLYYSAEWQVLEERESGVVKVQHVWSPVYIDAMIARDRDADGNSGNGLEERLYVQHDANFNVSAILNTSGAVQERYIYDPYGSPTILDASWAVLGGSSFEWTYLHQGGRRDSTSTSYGFRERDYSPSLGRWSKLDPIMFAGHDTNFYRGIANSPLSITDPLGTDPLGAPVKPIAPGLPSPLGGPVGPIIITGGPVLSQQLNDAWGPPSTLNPNSAANCLGRALGLHPKPRPKPASQPSPRPLMWQLPSEADAKSCSKMFPTNLTCPEPRILNPMAAARKFLEEQCDKQRRLDIERCSIFRLVRICPGRGEYASGVIFHCTVSINGTAQPDIQISPSYAAPRKF